MNRTMNEPKSSHLLDEKFANDLLSSELKTPKFKMLPKVYKDGNPGRPVVSSIDCHTTKISKYINNQLHPHVKELKTYVKCKLFADDRSLFYLLQDIDTSANDPNHNLEKISEWGLSVENEV